LFAFGSDPKVGQLKCQSKVGIARSLSVISDECCCDRLLFLGCTYPC